MTLSDLTGPQFLLVYAVIAAAALSAAHLLGRGPGAASAVPQLDTTDPHLLAYLRAGPNEALRIAVASLLDRGLLRMDTRSNGRVVVAAPRGEESARRPIEKAVIRHFAGGAAPESVFRDRALIEATGPYASQLEGLGLVLDDQGRASRRMRFILAIGLLAAIAGWRILEATGRGRTNIVFLVVEAGLVLLIGIWLFRWSQRTALGDRVLADLRNLFSGLRARANGLRPGAATNETALVASLFGISALPSNFSEVRSAYPKATKGTRNGWASSCGSVGGGSSCGGSCGGGGCGGGCGGCGG